VPCPMLFETSLLAMNPHFLHCSRVSIWDKRKTK
jgi:hypothetical protein